MKLRDFARQIGIEAGCSDSGCIWGNQGGQCTNGGCRCGTRDAMDARLEMRRFARVARHLADRVEKAKR